MIFTKLLTHNPKHMNILNKSNRALAPMPGNIKAIPKREKYSWATPSEPGQFLMIAKESLNIDGSYQREQVSESKVMEIARDWDWKLFGVLAVIRRRDGTLWVYDGGHRTRAAFLRDDIASLPCMVFHAADEKEEAKAFIGTNTMVSIVSAYHKHRAYVKAGEPNALAVQSILEKYGYFPAGAANKRGNFAALNTLRTLVIQNGVEAEKVFAACAKIAVDREPISGEVVAALYTCQAKLAGKADILSNGHLDRLIKEGLAGIEAAIRREKHIVGLGGNLVGAKAVLDLLNKGKQRRLTFA